MADVTREVSLIRQMFARIDSGDWPALSGLFAADVTYHRPGYPPFAGREAVLHFYEHVRMIASGTHRLESVIADGAEAACWGRFHGVSRDGTSIDIEFAEGYRFRDGKLAERKSFFFLPGV